MLCWTSIFCRHAANDAAVEGFSIEAKKVIDEPRTSCEEAVARASARSLLCGHPADKLQSPRRFELKGIVTEIQVCRRIHWPSHCTTETHGAHL